MEYGKYIIYLIVLTLVGYLFDKYNLHNQREEDERHYNLVNKFLLTDSSMLNNLPIIWIHASTEVNSRYWSSFYSRNSTNMNQPYEFLTIKSVIDRCGESFNVCLIDDSKFEKLLPDWKTDLEVIADPLKSKVRELAYAKILYRYGGLRLPESFLCMKDLKELYNEGTHNDNVIIGELIDSSIIASKNKLLSPSTEILGCQAGCNVMNDYIEYMQRLISLDNTAESIFNGSISKWFMERKDVSLISGHMLGVLDNNKELITVDRLAGNTNIPICNLAYGVYFPAKDILKRTAYQWLARLSVAQILSSDTSMGKMLLVGSQDQIKFNY